MKIHPDHTMSNFMLIIGVFFAILSVFAYFSASDKVNVLMLFLLGISIITMMISCWWREAFEVTDDKLTKTNFLGLFKKTINLKQITRYDKKVIKMDTMYTSGNILSLLSTSNRYLVFRRITIYTKTSGKMRVDERSIKKDDFHRLFLLIKSRKGKR